MSNWLACLFIFIFLIKGNSQQIVREFDLQKGHTLKDIELLSFNDSIVLMMSLQNREIGQNEIKTFLVVPGKEFIPSPNLYFFNNNPICGVLRLSGGIKLFYFVEQDKKRFHIKAFKVDFANRRTVTLPGELAMDGSFLRMNIQNGQVNIYSYAESRNAFQETVLIDLKVNKQNDYVIPFEIPTSNREICLITENDNIGAIQAKAKCKIFLSQKFITAILDDHQSNYNTKNSLNQSANSINHNAKNSTKVARFDRQSGKISTRIIKEPSSKKFSSAVFDTLLYRTVISKDNFYLQVFNCITGSAVYSSKLDPSAPVKDSLVYFREGRANRISKIESLSHMMKVAGLCQPFVVVSSNKDSTSQAMITWGTYYDSNGVSAPIGIGTNPIAAILTMAIGTTIKQLVEGPGISRYFYMVGTPANGFAYTYDPPCLRVKIDSFEMTQQNQQNRGYFQSEDSLLAVYYDIKLKRIRIVKFSL